MDQDFKVPQPKRKHKEMEKDLIDTNILEEEEYLERMGKIIKRDFFPDFKKLQDFKNKQYSNNFIIYRANLQEEESEPDKMTLNQFLKQLKSEDTETLKGIMARDAEHFKEKNWWIYLQEKLENQRQLRQIEGDETLKAIKQKEKLLAVCPYEGLSSFFYAPQRWINEVKSEKKKEAQTLYENTRFPETAKDFNLALQHEKKKLENSYYTNLDTPHLLGLKEANKRQIEEGEQYDLSNLKKTNQELKGAKKIQINGYDLLDIPEISPGKDDQTPIMTWGEIEDTPQRIGADKQYKIPQFSDRERIADAIQQKFQTSKISTIKKNQQKLKDVISSVTPNARIGNQSVRRGSKLVQELIKMNQQSHRSVFGTPVSTFSDTKSVITQNSYRSKLSAQMKSIQNLKPQKKL